MIMFQQKLQNTGYNWFSIKRCLACIDNTEDVMQGKSPKVHYALECELINKYDSFSNKDFAAMSTEILRKELGVAIDSISIIIGYYLYSDFALPKFTWIVSNAWEKPFFYNYSSYFIENPTEEGIQMYQALLDYNYINRPREIEALNKTILEMKIKLAELQKVEGQIGSKKD